MTATDAFANNGLYWTSVMAIALRLAQAGTGVISGCAVTQQAVPDMTVKAAIGEVFLSATKISAPAVAVISINAAHATLDRYDLITINSSGVFTYTAGTADANAVPPEIPASSIPVSVIYVAAAATSIADAVIYDLRITLKDIIAPVGSIVQWTRYMATGGGATTSNAHGQTLNLTSSTVTTKTGPLFKVKNANRILVSVTKTASSSATTAYLEDENGIILAKATYSANVATFYYPLQNDRTYALTNDAGGSAWSWEYKNLPTYPISATDINWTGERDNGVDGTTNLPALTNITTITATAITPDVPDGWLECTPQTISDSDSPINGRSVPGLNSIAETIIYIIRIK